MFKLFSGAEKFKGNVFTFYTVALLLEIIGFNDKAINFISKALNSSRNVRELHLHASRLYLKAGQVDRAVMHWKKAAGPENIGSFLYWLNKTDKRLNHNIEGDETKIQNPWKNPASEARKWPVKQPLLNDVGLGLLDRGYINEALQIFLQDLSTGKNDPALLFNIGLSCSKLNQHREALDYYIKAQNMGLNNLILLNNKGYSLFCLERFEEAQTCYELARGLEANDYTILNNLAACYFKTGQINQAQACFMAAVKNNYNDATLINNLAMCLEYQSNIKEALRYYEQALAFAHNITFKRKILINMLNCLINNKMHSEALELCDNFLPNGVVDHEIWGLQADLLNKLGRKQEAADSYRKALGLVG